MPTSCKILAPLMGVLLITCLPLSVASSEDSLSYPPSGDVEARLQKQNSDILYSTVDCVAMKIKSRRPLEAIPARRIIFIAHEDSEFVFPVAVDTGPDWESKSFRRLKKSAVVLFLDWEMKDVDILADTFDFPRSLSGEMADTSFRDREIYLKTDLKDEIGTPMPFNTFTGEMSYRLDRQTLALKVADGYISTLEYQCTVLDQQDGAEFFSDFMEYQSYFVNNLMQTVIEAKDAIASERKF